MRPLAARRPRVQLQASRVPGDQAPRCALAPLCAQKRAWRVFEPELSEHGEHPA